MDASIIADREWPSGAMSVEEYINAKAAVGKAESVLVGPVPWYVLAKRAATDPAQYTLFTLGAHTHLLKHNPGGTITVFSQLDKGVSLQ